MPWRAYRGEWLVILLIGIAALSLHHAVGQDQPRFALTQALYEDGSTRIDRFIIQNWEDKAFYEGHFYPLHAPGLSFAAIPTFAVLDGTGVIGAEEREQGVWETEVLAWTLRVLTSGALFLVGTFALGRVAEGLAEGTGAATAVAFGLGTLTLELAAGAWGHVAAGALAVVSFFLAWAALERGPGRKWILALAGLCAGFAVMFEYQAALAGAVLLAYVVWRSRRLASVAAFSLGALPALLALGAYHWAAFGNPFRTGYTYSANSYADQQREGFFGIGAPDPDTVYRILLTRHGVLSATPILVLAAAGLVLLWRTGRRSEAAVCGVTTLLFFFLNAGYFEPYGGASPGPRFFAVAIPFLAVGLAPAVARWPRLTAAAALVSVAVTILDASTASFSFADLGSVDLTETIWSLAGAPVPLGLAIVWAATIGALAVAALALFPRARAPEVALKPKISRWQTSG